MHIVIGEDIKLHIYLDRKINEATEINFLKRLNQ